MRPAKGVQSDRWNLSNKLLTTAFEASLGCVAVMRRAKRRQRGSRDSYRAPKYQQTRASTLWSEGKTICGFIVKVRFHTAPRRRNVIQGLYVNLREPIFSQL